MPSNTESTLALDIGAARIGVAIAANDSQFPRPLKTLVNDEKFTETLQALIDNDSATALVVGLPRGLNGQETAQTEYVRAFVDNLKEHIALPIHYQDEALSSVRAKEELTARGRDFSKGEVDALAATYILEDYLGENRE